MYQTNHGASHDLAGSDRANPVGQIYSLAMLLAESFGLMREASAIQQAVARVSRYGYRTFDIEEDGCQTVERGKWGNLSPRRLPRSHDVCREPVSDRDGINRSK